MFFQKWTRHTLISDLYNKKASDTKIFRIFRITGSFIVTFIVYYARTAQRSFVDRALPFCAHSCADGLTTSRAKSV